jgi:hypothetical protein
MGFYSRSHLDYDGEKTVFRLQVADLNAGNIAAQLGLQAAFGAACNDMQIGVLSRIAYGNEVLGVLPAPTDPWAQRETKWFLTYRDTLTGDEWYSEIGTADLTRLNPNNRKSAFIGDGAEVDAFIAAWEDYILAPKTLNPTEVVSIIPVGRNT